MLPVTPLRVHNHHDAAIVVGTEGGLIGLNKNGQVTDVLRPMSNPISSSVLLDGHLVAAWNLYGGESISSYMGLISTETLIHFGRIGEIGLESDANEEPEGATWWRKLEGTVESVGGSGSRFIFALSGLGIYSMDIEIHEKVASVNETWRVQYPIWTLSSGPEIRDRIASILVTDSGILIISEGGEWVLLSVQDGVELGRGFLDLRNPVNRAEYSIGLGTMIMTRGKEFVLMDNDLEIIEYVRKIPGPVLGAYADNEGWKWTGWRHDGSFKNGRVVIRMRPEIGIGMLGTDRCICNDGFIEKWNGYSSESEVV
ncbi:MAG: hypothetical protein CMB75_01855 [Euryarchaeota archaeon]|nr:hypothetical protein [Euryarchaeota archaeon]|tara:strand:+ start:7907 stop:8845 length:939 start_codon:yes stop_codon:yes gene_type:complete